MNKPALPLFVLQKISALGCNPPNLKLRYDLTKVVGTARANERSQGVRNSTRTFMGAFAAVSTLFGVACDHKDAVAPNRFPVQRSVYDETLECASGDRTLELRAAIYRIKSGGGGTLYLRSKLECPGGYEYSAQDNPNVPGYDPGPFNGWFDNDAVAPVPITIQSTRTPTVPNTTRIDISSQDVALLWTNSALYGVGIFNDTFKYLEIRGPDWNNSNVVNHNLYPNHYGVNGAHPNYSKNWVIDHSIIHGFRNNGILGGDSTNAKVQHSIIRKNAMTGLAFYGNHNTTHVAINNLIELNGNDGIDTSGRDTIRDNAVLNNGVGIDIPGGDKNGILVYACAGGVVENNVTRGNAQDGIRVANCVGGTGAWSIRGNTFGSNTSYGISLHAPIYYPVIIEGDNVCERGNGLGCFTTGVTNVTYPTPPGHGGYSSSANYTGTSVAYLFDGNLENGWGPGDQQGWVAFGFQPTSFNKVRIFTGANNSQYESFAVDAYLDGQRMAASGWQERWVTAYAQGGGWIELSIKAGTYDSLKVQGRGWRYPIYSQYWNDPAGGAWVSFNELWLANSTPPAETCGTPAAWTNPSSSGVYPGTSYASMFDNNVVSGWGPGDHEGWVAFDFYPTQLNTVKVFTGANNTKVQTFAVEAYRNGQLVDQTGYQQRTVMSYAQGGGWVEFGLTPNTYDRFVIRLWGWRYPTYSVYWNDPAGGGWVGSNEVAICTGG